MAILELGAEIQVVRIPELPEQENLANEDKIAIWHASSNVTEGVSLATLRSFIETGSGGTLDPIYSGGSILYIVPASADGLDQVSIPQIAGYDFKLRRDGYPMKPGTEFLRLDGGGFKLLGGLKLIEGQRYELDIFELYAGAVPSPSGGGGGGGFILGNTTINTNIAISINDLNKVHQVRGAGNALEIILPDVESCPDNSFVIIETLINNTKQHKILTTSSQYIYMNNQSISGGIYIGVGEYVWFYRSADGWYVIVDKGNFVNIGNPVAVYKKGLNQIELNGQELQRADYPRLWQIVQAFGASLVNELVWNTVSATVQGRTVLRPYRGCWSQGNGTTTFRVPDLNGVTLRGITNPGGSDAGRYHNSPGGFQRHEFESHEHGFYHGNGGGITTTPGGGAIIANDANPTESDGWVLAEGGTETRMDNVGVTWVTYY